VTRPQLFDVVRLTIPMPKYGLDVGETGTIVVEFDSPNEAYEVEFCDDYGRTRAMFPLTPDQFEVVWSVASGEWVHDR
jgi:hypothetical protein